MRTWQLAMLAVFAAGCSKDSTKSAPAVRQAVQSYCSGLAAELSATADALESGKGTGVFIGDPRASAISILTKKLFFCAGVREGATSELKQEINLRADELAQIDWKTATQWPSSAKVLRQLAETMRRAESMPWAAD